MTPTSDDTALTRYLWPIVCGIMKTAIENKQNLIVEGCYIPFDWQTYFDKSYLYQIRCICLIMSERYIRTHFEDIKRYAGVIEQRLGDSDYTEESALQDNAKALDMCKRHHTSYLLIDQEYHVDFEL